MLRKPEDFLREGSKVFRKAPVNTASIEGWVKISGGKAADAGRKANSASTRLGAAYDSVFNLSLAVLCKKGWRCTAADGHHAQALEAACAYAGITASVFRSGGRCGEPARLRRTGHAGHCYTFTE